MPQPWPSGYFGLFSLALLVLYSPSNLVKQSLSRNEAASRHGGIPSLVIDVPPQTSSSSLPTGSSTPMELATWRCIDAMISPFDEDEDGGGEGLWSCMSHPTLWQTATTTSLAFVCAVSGVSKFRSWLLLLLNFSVVWSLFSLHHT